MSQSNRIVGNTWNNICTSDSILVLFFSDCTSEPTTALGLLNFASILESYMYMHSTLVTVTRYCDTW